VNPGLPAGKLSPKSEMKIRKFEIEVILEPFDCQNSEKKSKTIPISTAGFHRGA
jgi:hypothetical protein